LCKLQTLDTVCYQIRAETALLKYTVNDFTVARSSLAEGLEGLPEEVCEWLRGLEHDMKEEVRPGHWLFWWRCPLFW
jgi:hypothetical protein